MSSMIEDVEVNQWHPIPLECTTLDQGPGSGQK